MRALGRVVLALAVALAVSPALAKPARVVSTNLCADQLALWLAEPARLHSVSRLAADADLSYFAARVGPRPLNRGLAEEVLALRPDLVLAGQYQAQATNRLLRGQGIAVVEVGIADSLAAIVGQLRLVGAALGEEAGAEQAIGELPLAAATVFPPADAPRALVLRPSGYSAGGGSLGDELLSRAGLRNAAREMGLRAFALLSLEQIAALSPALFVLDRHDERANSLAERLLAHPALRGARAKASTVVLPTRLWICPSPGIAQALARLAAASAMLRLH